MEASQQLPHPQTCGLKLPSVFPVPPPHLWFESSQHEQVLATLDVEDVGLERIAGGLDLISKRRGRADIDLISGALLVALT